MPPTPPEGCILRFPLVPVFAGNAGGRYGLFPRQSGGDQSGRFFNSFPRHLYILTGPNRHVHSGFRRCSFLPAIPPSDMLPPP